MVARSGAPRERDGGSSPRRGRGAANPCRPWRRMPGHWDPLGGGGRCPGAGRPEAVGVAASAG